MGRFLGQAFIQKLASGGHDPVQSCAEVLLAFVYDEMSDAFQKDCKIVPVVEVYLECSLFSALIQ